MTAQQNRLLAVSGVLISLACVVFNWHLYSEIKERALPEAVAVEPDPSTDPWPWDSTATYQVDSVWVEGSNGFRPVVWRGGLPDTTGFVIDAYYDKACRCWRSR